MTFGAGRFPPARACDRSMQNSSVSTNSAILARPTSLPPFVTVVGLFVDAAAGNFQLKAGSPALNIGADLSAVVGGFTLSKNGALRPQGGAWDIGAFELAASTGTSPGITAHPTNITATTGT